MMTSGRIASLEELRELYREPSALVQSKVVSSIDPVSKTFIELAPFLLLATVGVDGRLDVSPRGGPSGFVRVLPTGEIVIPDLNGNNLLDTLTNVVQTGQVGAIFVLPGKDETLRVNGSAILTTSVDVLDGCIAELRRPKSAIVITPHEVFIHCAKAFRRGSVWDPESWTSLANGPDGADMLFCQLQLGDPAPFRQKLADGYDAELALDRPLGD
jgi:uncharacterized protein